MSLPIRRVLIANRGEIAVRIARTARRLGLATVAVHSDVDRDAPHVRACDDAVALGGRTAAESYLCAERVLEAARRARADAVHPGYGFLAENAAFAEAVVAAGLTFVGPPPAAIAAMGDKARARRRVAAAGLPVVAGYDGDAQDPATFAAEAARIGYPVMVKAAAGGGGRGMRRVDVPGDLPDALRSAAAEAAKAFGDGRLILERAVHEPRHVEVQVFADAHGRLVHMGERDCSVQRRHQKLVEESPSPAVDRALRERMGATALAVAREIGYVGAGTVEFLLDRDGAHYFMEMNTRLQVEHPVTELVTGLDLVEWQFRVAAGEPLPWRQSDLLLDGHAVEVRLCAESPAEDFLPQTGPVVDWRAPPGVRCDHALAAGLEVGPWYDSMLAKLVAHAPTRAEALARLATALEETVLLGVATNRALLARVLRHPAFASGDAVSTAFLDRHFGDVAQRATEPDATTWALAAWLSVAAAPETLATPAGWRHWTTGRPLPAPWRLRWRAAAAPDPLRPCEAGGRVTFTGDGAAVETGDTTAHVAGPVAAAATDARVRIDDAWLDYRYAWHGATLWLHTRAGDFAFECRRRAAGRTSAPAAADAAEVRAPMNARVVEVVVAAGAEVRAGDRLVVLESMKMEHEVRAPRAGRIVETAVHAGEQVAPGRVLARYAEER